MDRDHICVFHDFLYTIIVLRYGMSLVNIYWIKFWSSIYFSPFPFPSHPMTSYVCLLPAVTHHGLYMKDGPQTFDRGMGGAT